MRLLMPKVICFETGLVIPLVSQWHSSLEMRTINPCIDIGCHSFQRCLLSVHCSTSWTLYRLVDPLRDANVKMSWLSEIHLHSSFLACIYSSTFCCFLAQVQDSCTVVRLISIQFCRADLKPIRYIWKYGAKSCKNIYTSSKKSFEPSCA